MNAPTVEQVREYLAQFDGDVLFALDWLRRDETQGKDYVFINADILEAIAREEV